MRKMTKKNKIAAVALSATLLAAGGGAAYAYWSTTGSGTGSAVASAGNNEVTLHSSFATGIAPGETRAVTYTADNSNTSSTVVAGLAPTVATSDAKCLASWFTVDASNSPTTVLAKTTGTTVGTGTLTFTDTADNQDACKTATITVNVTSH
ncbi:hypothetical protein FBY30_2220 [Arthrobacter sp. SLBN-83]|uniref:hypothetical protein n=1 Tax=Arthrobacter sp. SLBN-83 TaxID=2768449 RepID=UPI00114D843C|nr:hypothetical protein [Arthrobacter sp. SLBN-83]TQJ59963.1 hypothetical protein FBY30_2220 [Arthrobacter sp. SLBN-83]